MLPTACTSFGYRYEIAWMDRAELPEGFRQEWCDKTTIDEDHRPLINNRQNGRRRGRGGQQPGRGPGNGQDRGNRIDSRARGNAAQLHEKYRNLARDAQTQGDRVMTEYYLQFADHYFRVLSESRARFEEQNQNQPRRQRDDQPRDDGDYLDTLDQDEGEEGFEGERYDRRPQPQYQPRSERPNDRQGEQRYERQDRAERQDRGERSDMAERGEPGERQPAPQPVAAAPDEAGEDGEARRPRRGRRPRRAEGEEGGDRPQRIDIDRLPPAFAAAEPEPAVNGHAAIGQDNAAPADAEPAGEEPAPKRRRTRRVPKADDDSSVAA